MPSIIITGLEDPTRIIQAIKAIRPVTGLGLKEAKHLADDLVAGRAPYQVEKLFDLEEAQAALATLKEGGVIATASEMESTELIRIASRLAIHMVRDYKIDAHQMQTLARLLGPSAGAEVWFYAAQLVHES